MAERAAVRSGSSALVWLRADLDREVTRAHWAGPHAQLVARTPGFDEYRQHHFAPEGDGAWPAVEGVETVVPAKRRIDGMPEVTFAHAWSPLLGGRQAAKIRRDERNAFARTTVHLTDRGGGRWLKSGHGEDVRARVVILLRRRGGVRRGAWRTFVHDVLGPALDGADGTLELRTQTFLPFNRRLWDSPGVAHDYPPDERFHASIVLGASRREALGQVMSTVSGALAAELREHCVAIHAYDVEQTYVFTRHGRPTLPQVRAEPKLALDPVVRTDIPPAPDRAKRPRSATPFPPARLIPLPGEAPEDVVVDPDGRLLCGLEGGRIVRVDPRGGRCEQVGDTGGRPLGLEVEPDGRVLVCNAHIGLLRLDPGSGRVETLVRLVDDVPLRFCSNATAAEDGTIWFTESTTRFDFEQNLGAILEHRPSGRLLRRDPDGSVEVVRDRLHFANGVTLTEDESAVLFAETGAARISRYEIASGVVEVVADNLPGYPDNVSRLRDGRFWVALVYPRDALLERLATSAPLLRKLLWRVPERLMPEGTRTTWAMAFDEHGNELADMQDDRDDFHSATGVAEHDGHVYLAALAHPVLLDVDVSHSPARA